MIAPGKAFVVTTAPTYKQVRTVLCREIDRAHRIAMPAITLEDKWYVGQELVGFGRKPADYDPSAFQGIYARYVLVIFDEAGGAPKTIFDAVDSLATNIYARVLAIGNPDDPASHFATICKPGSGWKVIRISAFDTPRLHGRGSPRGTAARSGLGRAVDERKKRWGTTSPIYTAKILGEFPDISDDTLIMPKWIEAARRARNRGRCCRATSPASARTRLWGCAGKADGSAFTAPTTRPTR